MTARTENQGKRCHKDKSQMTTSSDQYQLASQAAARKAQPLWQQLGFQAKIYEKKNTSNDTKEKTKQAK